MRKYRTIVTVFFIVAAALAARTAGAMEKLGPEDIYTDDGRIIISGFFSEIFEGGDDIQLMKFDKPAGEGIAISVNETYIVVALRHLETDALLKDITGIRMKPDEEIKTIAKTIGPESFMPRDNPVIFEYDSAEEIEKQKREGRLKVWTAGDEEKTSGDREFLERIGRIKAEHDDVKELDVKSTISSSRRDKARRKSKED